MALQSAQVVLIGSGFVGEVGLRDGVHLRWQVRPEAGFPDRGFDLYRREHRPGTPRVLSFDDQALRELSAVAEIGPTRWETTALPPRIVNVVVGGSSGHALRPSYSALTCRFDPADGLVRRIELDIVHNRVQGSQPPVTLSLWGVSRSERVAEGQATLTGANAGSLVTVSVQGDALDGFQVWADSFAILAVRWVLVSDEAELGWGSPLNPRPIGLPLTAPGYLVRHAHWPDTGQGQQDWQEAADRLAMNVGPPLPAALDHRLGLPRFQSLRGLMRSALSVQQPLRSTPASPAEAQLEVSAVEALLLLAIDADLARLLGLAWIDRSAVTGTRYDYRIVARRAGRPTLRWVCSDDPPPPPPPPGDDSAPDDPVVVVPGVTAGVTISAVSGIELHFRHSAAALAALDNAELPALRLSGIGKRPERKGVPVRPLVAATSARSTQLAWPGGAERIRVTLQAAPDSEVVVLALRGQEIVEVSQVPIAGGSGIGPAAPLTVEVGGSGLTGGIVIGIDVVVVRVCWLVLAPGGVTDGWIAFDLRRAAAPAMPVPAAPTGSPLPVSPAELDVTRRPVALWLAPRPPATRPSDLFPMALLPRDPVRRELLRRGDGAAPQPDPAVGSWQALPLDAEGFALPIALSRELPPAHRLPEGWPVDAPDFIDRNADAALRFFSYRQRGIDLFGRRSDWSPLGAVDAADRLGPPAPDLIGAAWLDASQATMEDDDLALLAEHGASDGLRVAWRWRAQRQRQAPDTAAFRVYWHGSDFDTLKVQLGAVQAAGDEFIATLTLPAGTGNPPTDALAGDWLRQGARQYLVRASQAASPPQLRLAASGQPAPHAGAAVLQLRAPDPQRLELLGSPLRRDRSDALSWDERVLELPRTDVSGAVAQAVPGVPLMLGSVVLGSNGRCLVTLDGGWVGAALPLPSDWTLAIGATAYPVIGGQLGRRPHLLLDATLRPAPVPGAATLLGSATALATISLPIAAALAQRPDLRGGTLQHIDPGSDGAERPVWAHRIQGTQLELVASAMLQAGQNVRWWPNHEVLLTQRPWVVSAAMPDAVAFVGVSAVDSRPYSPDRRNRPGEPSSAGNEGVVAAAKVLRRYLGAPGVAPTLAGAAELWATVPAPFSGVSRHVLRWTAQTDAAAYVVWRASLDAVLDAAQPALDAPALSAWRAQQMQLGAAALQALADAQPAAFKAAHETPLAVTDPMLADAGGGLRWHVPLDGSAPGRWFLRLQAIDAAGHAGALGASSPPIRVPDVRRPAPPPMRPARAADRGAWLAWENTEPDGRFTLLRADSAAAAADASTMTVVASGTAATFPEPLMTSAGTLRLPGAPAVELVALYRAEDYDTTRAADAQTAAPLADATTLAADAVSGITSVDEGARLFATVRRVAGGPVELAVSASGCARFDRSLVAGLTYHYRVRVQRSVPVSASELLALDSALSAVATVTPFDARPLVPPALQLSWDAAAGAVHITWPTAGLDPALEARVERCPAGLDMFSRVLDWSAASAASANDAEVASGQAYSWRLRLRAPDGRQSSNEPVHGPLQVP